MDIPNYNFLKGSFSVILVDTANNINMSHSVTPMAYRSLKTLAQAILLIFHKIEKVKKKKYKGPYLTWWTTDGSEH